MPFKKQKMDYNFNRHRIDKFSKDKIIKELERVAGLFQYTEFGKRDFNKVANISHNPVVKTFGSWSNAMFALSERLKEKEIDLKKKKRAFISNQELFDEMGRIWKEFGHRPSRIEWESCNPKYSLQPYKTRFGGWRNACLAFLEYKMGKEIYFDKIPVSHENLEISKIITIREHRKRNVSLKLRLDVLNRDNFRCIFCGRSPATDIGVELHIDHKIPFSKGGETTFENLQTLCLKCNLGKSDRDIN